MLVLLQLPWSGSLLEDIAAPPPDLATGIAQLVHATLLGQHEKAYSALKPLLLGPRCV